MTDEGRLERLSGMLRRRGFLLPALKSMAAPKASTISAPLAAGCAPGSTSDGLTIGCNSETWLNSPVQRTLRVLEASGHVGEFSDFMTECGACGEASRADTLLEDHHPTLTHSNAMNWNAFC